MTNHDGKFSYAAAFPNPKNILCVLIQCSIMHNPDSHIKIRQYSLTFKICLNQYLLSSSEKRLFSATRIHKSPDVHYKTKVRIEDSKRKKYRNKLTPITIWHDGIQMGFVGHDRISFQNVCLPKISSTMPI